MMKAQSKQNANNQRRYNWNPTKAEDIDTLKSQVESIRSLLWQTSTRLYVAEDTIKDLKRHLDEMEHETKPESIGSTLAAIFSMLAFVMLIVLYIRMWLG